MDLAKAPIAEITALVKLGKVQLDEIPTAQRELVAACAAGKGNEDEVDEMSRGNEPAKKKTAPKKAKGKKKDAK